MRNAPKKSVGSLSAHSSQHGRMKTLAGAKSDSRVTDAENFLLPTYKRQPFVLERGKGCYVFDAAGKKYLDFLGGIAVNALGHAHPRIVKVIRREAARAIHFSNLYHNAYQGPLARKLAEWSGLDRVFFCNSGTEAVDGAMKLARLCARTPQDAAGQPSRKHRFLALENSFHGRPYGAISVTATEKYRLPFAPVVPGVEFVRFNDVADLESKFDNTVCGILIETVQGEGGIYPFSELFWSRAQTLAMEHNALMIADEIQCGLGRTGRYFAYQRFASKPDIAVIAKPLAAGLPLGAILATNKVASYISPGLHGTTFGGGPLVCAAALECLQIIEDEKLLENVRSRGEELKAGLQALAAEFDFIREVRAEGLMLGVHLSIEGAPLVVTRAKIREFLKWFNAVLAAVSEKSATAEDNTAVTRPSKKYATAR